MQQDVAIHLFTINGKLLRSVDANEHVIQMTVTRDGEYVITAGRRVLIRSVFEYASLIMHPWLN